MCHTLMALDTHGNVFGHTMNPKSTAVITSGNSGGEGVDMMRHKGGGGIICKQNIFYIVREHPQTGHN
jgi:hypothetical protein